MNIRNALTAILVMTLIQGCSFTNRKYEVISEHNDYIDTATNVKIGKEYTVHIGELAIDSIRMAKLNNIINCPRRIEYRDGIAKYIINPGRYRALGLLEVQPGIKLPFIRGGIQEAAVRGAYAQELYYPINKDGSIYPAYYTDAFFNLSNGHKAGKLKEWGGSATASDTCDYIGPTQSDIKACTVHYLGPTRIRGFLAPTLAINENQRKYNEHISAGSSYTFCGTTIKVHEATNILNFTATGILSNQNQTQKTTNTGEAHL